MRQGPRIDFGWWLVAILFGLGVWLVVGSLF